MIKLPQDYYKYLHSFYEKKIGDVEVEIVTSGNPGEHCPRYGELIKNPTKLIYDNANWTTTMPHLTTIETKPGDLVFFDYQTCMIALGKLANPVTSNVRGEKWLRCGDDLYVFIPYRSLYIALRGDVKWRGQEISNLKDIDVICLNGYTVVETMYEEVKSSVIIPEIFKQKKELHKSKVIYCGSINKENGDGLKDASNIKVGDVVISRPIRVPMETSIAAILGNKNLNYLQRKFIFATEY